MKSLPTICLIGTLVLAATVSASAQTFTGSITSTDPTQTGRVFRDGVMSVAGVQKAYPGTTSTSDLFHYDAYTFVNPFAVTTPFLIDYSTTDPTNSVFSVTYLGSFNPANISFNYLADSGLSVVAGVPQTYSFNIPANGTFVVILNEVGANSGVSNYSFTLGLFNPTAVPEGGSTLPLLGLALLGLAGARRFVATRGLA